MQAIELKIDTGTGAYPTIASAGTIPDAWQPILDIALGGRPLSDIDGRRSNDVINDLDRAIDSLQNRRRDYENLPNPDRANRTIVLKFFGNWRNLCQQHPNSINYLNP